MKQQTFNLALYPAKQESFRGSTSTEHMPLDKRQSRESVTANSLEELRAIVKEKALSFGASGILADGENAVLAYVSVLRGERKPRGFDGAMRGLVYNFGEIPVLA